MVQKIITSLSLIFIFSGCNFLATSNHFLKISREVDAVEEELEDLSHRSKTRKKDLEAKVRIINQLIREDKLFRGAISRLENALFQDLQELEIRTDSTMVSAQKLENIIKSEKSIYMREKETSKLIWEKRKSGIIKTLCEIHPDSSVCRK
ncbi:MAG: hypothetical protein JXR95_07735 [Deltaproteobacteria bacterium]|nr:hypothetical protein [Deltaproteobacteria bacterium]